MFYLIEFTEDEKQWTNKNIFDTLNILLMLITNLKKDFYKEIILCDNVVKKNKQ
jgi:hypothetical protein